MSEWPRPVVAFMILANDLPAMRMFYSEMFDWDISVNEAGIATIPPGKGPPEAGNGGVILPRGDRASAISIFIQVASLNESLTKAETLGGKIISQPFDVPGGPTIANIEDPEGNLLGLVQM